MAYLQRGPDVIFDMMDGLVQFEAEVQSLNQIRSRVICPDSEGPWIEGGMEDLMVHFTYASWTAYNLGCALSMALASKEEDLGQSRFGYDDQDDLDHGCHPASRNQAHARCHG